MSEDLKGVMRLSEKEKAIIMSLAEAFNTMPESKREYLLGYADGVAGMQAKAQNADEEKEEE